MSYYYQKNETINSGTIRIATSQIKAAKRKLKRDNASPLDIHNTRKYFKKIRALIRLNRFKLGKATFKYENYYFRDLARSLSLVSDSDAAIETIDFLKNASNNEISEESYLAIRSKLVEQALSLLHTHKIDEIVQSIHQEFNSSQKRIRNWQLQENHWKCFKKAFNQSYTNGFNHFQALNEKSTDDDFHEWRKEVKLLRFQIALVELLSNGWLIKKTHLFKELSSLLGKAQDLSVFCAILQDADFKLDNEEVIKAATEQKKQYYEQALKLASQAYSIPPNEFISALKRDLKPNLH